MIDDHTKAGDKLKDLAEAKGISLPTEPSASQKETANELSKLSNQNFDAKYMDGQINAHKTVIDFFQDEASGGSDADAKIFAKNTLPTLESHLEMAKDINGNL